MPYSPKISLNCLYCQNQYLGRTNSRFCCPDHAKRFAEKVKIEKSHKLFGEHNRDYWVQCPECNLRATQLGISHMKKHGFSKIDEVKKKYPNSNLFSSKTSKNMSDRMRGDKNPAFNHGGKFSPFSIKFVGYSEHDAKEKISKLH